MKKKLGIIVLVGIGLVNCMDVLGNRNLIVAVVQGNITKLDALLKEPGVQIDEPDQVGQTPLMWAVAKKDLDAVKKLIELKSSRIFAPLGASSSLH